MQSIRLYLQNLGNPAFISTGIKVALTVGTLLFIINHGSAVLKGQMTGDRWLAALLTYCVPYMVNVHGQYTSARRAQNQQPLSLS